MSLKIRLFRCLHAAVLFCLTLFFMASSCNKPGVDSADFDVRFEVPSEITLAEGADEISFRIMFSKAPRLSDLIQLKDYSGEFHDCPVTGIEGNRFTARLYEGISDGRFEVWIRRGSERKMMGETAISFETSIELEKGTTVYGVVSCGDRKLADVVVSDGVEVVKTDKNGLYQLKSEKKYGYIFISTPSGYVSAGESFLPAVHRQLMKSPASVERADFSLSEDGDQTKHTMLVFGDMHLANRTNDKAQFGNFVDDVNSYVSGHSGKVYGLTLGDLTWDIYWVTNKFDLDSYVETMSGIKGLKVYQTIGNHDHSCYLAGDFASAGPYREKIAPTFYSYNIGKVHYVALDDIRADNTGNYNDESHGRNHVSTLIDDDIEWLKKDLAFVSKDTPVVVSMHAPVYSDLGLPSVGNASALISALSGYKVHFLTAHTHKMYNVDRQNSSGIFEHNSAAVCATWWWTGKNVPGVHICQDGTPGGYRILNVDGTDFSWTYKATGSDTGYQFRSYDGNEVYMPADEYCSNATAAGKKLFEGYAQDWIKKSSDNYIYINVWDYDPSWTVSVTENGKELQCEKLSSIKDPLHLLVYTAVSVNGNSKAPTFPTSSTRHIFRAKASSPASTVEIKVTDRFGRTYTETMKRPKAFNAANYIK